MSFAGAGICRHVYTGIMTGKVPSQCFLQAASRSDARPAGSDVIAASFKIASLPVNASFESYARCSPPEQLQALVKEARNQQRRQLTSWLPPPAALPKVSSAQGLSSEDMALCVCTGWSSHSGSCRLQCVTAAMICVGTQAVHHLRDFQRSSVPAGVAGAFRQDHLELMHACTSGGIQSWHPDAKVGSLLVPQDQSVRNCPGTSF